jgi:hypothetical protein
LEKQLFEVKHITLPKQNKCNDKYNNATMLKASSALSQLHLKENAGKDMFCSIALEDRNEFFLSTALQVSKRYARVFASLSSCTNSSLVFD